MVDSRHHEVRLVVEETGEREMHAIRRRAVHAEAVFGNLLDPERHVHGQGVTGRGAVPVRSHDDDIGDRLKRFGEYVDACRKIAVVITYEDFHCCWDGRHRLAARDALTILNVLPAP